MTRPFVHALNEEVRSISGWYELSKERIIEHNGRLNPFLPGRGRPICLLWQLAGAGTPWSPERLLTGKTLKMRKEDPYPGSSRSRIGDPGDVSIAD